MYREDLETRTVSAELFKLLDSDRNGYLDQKELRRARTVMLCRNDVSEGVKDMISSMSTLADEDGDGKVSKDEWHEFMASVYALTGKKQLTSLVKYWISNIGVPAARPLARRKTHTGLGENTMVTSCSVGEILSRRPSNPRRPPTGLLDKRPVSTGSGNFGHNTPSRPPNERKTQTCFEENNMVAPSRSPNERKTQTCFEENNMASRPPNERKTQTFFEENNMVATLSGSFGENMSNKPSSDSRSSDDVATTEAAVRNIPGLRRLSMPRKSFDKDRFRGSPSRVKHVFECSHGLERVTSVAELWDLLTVSECGKPVTSIEIHDFVDYFVTMKHTGLDMVLAAVVPMRGLPESQVEPEDLSPGEVAHLSIAFMDKPDITDDEARAEIAPIRDECRLPENSGDSAWTFVGADAGAYRLTRAARWMELISALMRIDVDYIVTLLLWHRTGHFEMPEGLAVELLKLTMSEHAAQEGARLFSDGQPSSPTGDTLLLQKPFALNEFMRLVYRAGIVDSSGTKGLTYCALQQLFSRVWAQITKHMKNRAIAFKWTTCVFEFGKHEGGLVGRHEIAILLQQLWKDPRMQARFPSPLHMSVRFIQTAATSRPSVQRRKMRSSSLPQVRGGSKSLSHEADVIVEH